MRKLLILLATASTFFACSTTNINLLILKPADITVDRNIKSMVIVNRTLPESKGANIIEGIFTGEAIGQDRRAADEALRGLFIRLNEVQKFQVVHADERFVGSGSGHSFPQPFSWKDVETLCNQYRTDAVLALETFDTDASLFNTTRNVNQKDSKGNTFVQTLFRTTVNVKVALGFRLYYPASKTIYDQQQYTFNKSWWNEGKSAIEANRALISTPDAIMQTANYAGDMYAKKINPYYINVGRMYFKKANGDINMKTAGRYARMHNWTEAVKNWNNAIKYSKNPKVLKRGFYNIALVYEIEGNLEEALKLVEKSYAMGNKKALRYSQVLRNRIYDQQRLNDQLSE